MIKAREIVKRYGNLEVLKGVSLDIAKGEVVSIVGASGAGKSTLLHILGTLMGSDGGEVEIDGVNIAKMDDRALSKFRNRQIGFVFQFHNLLPEFTAFENICIPAYIGGQNRKMTEAKARELLKMMGLEHRADHKPSQLSGGEQQRVAIARAIINSPSVLFADEPSGNLDSQNREQIHRLFFDLRDKLGITTVVVTHDEQLGAMADRRIVMRDGLIVDEDE
ncbi:MAG: ABC transporter ATP-binding protein [Rikenellaceae bacterium]